MLRKISLGFVMIILGTLLEYFTHFFTDYASVFYGVIGMTWGLLFGLKVITRNNERSKHD